MRFDDCHHFTITYEPESSQIIDIVQFLIERRMRRLAQTTSDIEYSHQDKWHSTKDTRSYDHSNAQR